MPPPRKPSDNAFLKKLGKSIRDARLERGLTQEKVAEMIGMSARSYQAIEGGDINPPMTTMARIRKALGCDWNQVAPN